MMDHFKEEVAIRRNRTMYDIMYLMTFACMILAGVIALIMLQMVLSMVMSGAFDIFPIVGLIAFGGGAFLIWRYKDELKSEYEYTFTNGILDVAKVLNNRKRKYLTSLNMKEVTAAGPVAGDNFKRYVTMPGIKTHNWFLNRDADLYYYFFTKNQVKHLIVVELSKEMADLTHRANYMGQGIWQ